MTGHAALSLATTVDVHFAHPHSPWERGGAPTRTPTSCCASTHPCGTEITDDQIYLDA